jgi:large subunit ribosomal protein L13
MLKKSWSREKSALRSFIAVIPVVLGGMKTETFAKLQARIPERIIEHAVKGMLPKSSLGKSLFTKLKVYAGDSHPHEAQKPQALTIQTIPGGNN